MPYPRRKPTPLRVLCYAVNGLGLGHLTRLLAISRELRRLAWLCDLPIEIVFLTTSEADSLASLHNFAAFKLPSRVTATASGLDSVRYRKLAKQWIWNAVSLFSPDLLIVDTFPTGVFEELHDVLDFGSKNVFIYRAVRPAQALQPAFQAALHGYDLILKPGEAGERGNSSPVPETLEHRVVSTREILIRSRAEMLSPEVARELLGLPGDSTCVYISVGGGGDKEAEARYALLIEVARLLPHLQFVVGAGSLYRGREWHLPNLTWTCRPLMATLFRAFDAAITAGGYNTVAELMHAGVPAVFLPQRRTHDDQTARVQRCVESGAGILPESETAEAIADTLRSLLEPANRKAASEAAMQLVPASDALYAAEEILTQIVDRTNVERASDLRDAYVATALRLPEGWSEGEFLKAMGLVAIALSARDPDFEAEDEATTAVAATQRIAEVSHHREVAPREVIAALRHPDKENTSEAAILLREVLEVL